MANTLLHDPSILQAFQTEIAASSYKETTDLQDANASLARHTYQALSSQEEKSVELELPASWRNTRQTGKFRCEVTNRTAAIGSDPGREDSHKCPVVRPRTYIQEFEAKPPRITLSEEILVFSRGTGAAMALSFGTVSNIFYLVIVGTIVLNLVYIAAGVSAISLLLPK